MAEKDANIWKKIRKGFLGEVRVPKTGVEVIGESKPKEGEKIAFEVVAVGVNLHDDIINREILIKTTGEEAIRLIQAILPSLEEQKHLLLDMLNNISKILEDREYLGLVIKGGLEYAKGDPVTKLDQSIRSFVEALHEAKYKNIEFECLQDFEKCKKDGSRGNHLLCNLALTICLLRRIIPLIKIK